ncbi:hypothetical protein [Pseudomonas sp. KNUC1026]|uniref:hypothetical protein n=1 Tax=Pseudomonas sp. KNUC1026 TaxID=2893890 RepID=UPI001F2567C4|nr:hypothetical protein [Pseudomonas sp. KNUC1026]UFH49322.1 hypothetical protein LN139_21070 [Pseudomonas sp. KNUC1026]
MSGPSTLVLLDTNAYLRLAKRIRPMLGIAFGQKRYVLTILDDVESEMHRSSTLKSKFPWFDAEDLAAERLAKRIRLSGEEKAQLEVAQSVLRGWVLMNSAIYTTGGRSPPSPTDCRVLAFGQIRNSVVVTDDLGMHTLAADFDISVWHGPELLEKMLTAKLIDNCQVKSIFDALELNGDLTRTWRDAKHTVFVKLFGKRGM